MILSGYVYFAQLYSFQVASPQEVLNLVLFMVVAVFVSHLANQAKHATDTISKEIESLNGVASEVAASLTAIKIAIASVNEFIASTAAAVEEQSIVTSDMSSNMQRASAELA